MSDEKSIITPEDIHLPPPSYWPIVLAFGITCIMGGLAINISFTIIGIIITLVAAVGWSTEPGYEVPDDEPY